MANNGLSLLTRATNALDKYIAENDIGQSSNLRQIASTFAGRLSTMRKARDSAQNEIDSDDSRDADWWKE